MYVFSFCSLISAFTLLILFPTTTYHQQNGDHKNQPYQLNRINIATSAVSSGCSTTSFINTSTKASHNELRIPDIGLLASCDCRVPRLIFVCLLAVCHSPNLDRVNVYFWTITKLARHCHDQWLRHGHPCSVFWSHQWRTCESIAHVCHVSHQKDHSTACVVLFDRSL